MSCSCSNKLFKYVEYFYRRISRVTSQGIFTYFFFFFFFLDSIFEPSSFDGKKSMREKGGILSNVLEALGEI